MVQPDIVKMGGITGLQRCAALAHAHGVELVPHQTQPTIGHMASLHVAASQLHMTKPCELNDPSPRMHAVFDNPPKPVDGLSICPRSRASGYRSTKPSSPSAASRSPDRSAAVAHSAHSRGQPALCRFIAHGRRCECDLRSDHGGDSHTCFTC